MNDYILKELVSLNNGSSVEEIVLPKNKISGFKEKLVLDLDVTNIFLDPIDPELARQDTANFVSLKDSKTVKLSDNRVIIVQATEYEEEY